MPGFDRTGPMGAGPMTGGGRGVCGTAGAGGAGFGGGMGYYGRGFRRGFGFGSGIGMRRGFAASRAWNQPAYAGNPADELNMLRAEVDSAKNIFDAINRRIAELEKSL